MKKEWSGSGIKDTEKFTVGSEWRIEWSTEPGNLGSGNFVIMIYGESGMSGLAANVIGAGKDVSYQHKGGTFYLNIVSSMQPYTVRVLENQ